MPEILKIYQSVEDSPDVLDWFRDVLSKHNKKLSIPKTQ